MTDAAARQLMQSLERRGALDRERRKQLSDLYILHWRGLCRYVRMQFGAGPPEPEDIAQSAFARFAAADPARIENAQAFLYATARHLAIDHHRIGERGAEYRRTLESSAEVDSVYESTPDNVLLEEERFGILAQALERAPVKGRRMLLLNRYEGLSYGEIGQRFGLSAEAVRKHIERTLAACHQALEATQARHR